MTWERTVRIAPAETGGAGGGRALPPDYAGDLGRLEPAISRSLLEHDPVDGDRLSLDWLNPFSGRDRSEERLRQVHRDE